MAKKKSVFICGECGYESSGWLGKCPACNAWNTFFEQKIEPIKESTKQGIGTAGTGKAVKAVSVAEARTQWSQEQNTPGRKRIQTGIGELDRVLGGGIVPDSLVLVGGDPGIGKSTLLLQMGGTIQTEGKVLYISGEESVSQISMRAGRLNVENENLLLLSETNFEAVEQYIEDVKPAVVIIDSIQTVFLESVDSIPGSVGQVRAMTAALMRLAKNRNIAIFIVGHVTKDGNIAGPKVLEHMVDTVLYFEGDDYMNYRILRGVKNRFGSTNEIGIFEMRTGGLYEVPSPSESMLKGRPMKEPGSVVVCTIEGSRAMLVEVQALLSSTSFGVPRRTANGFDYNRMALLLAVMEKKMGVFAGDKDAYVNVVGGLRLTEPACDLGLVVALYSSFREMAPESSTIYIGEVGLTGEIRSVSQIEKRIGEAQRMGFSKVVIPQSNYEAMEKIGTLSSFSGIQICPIKTIRALLGGGKT